MAIDTDDEILQDFLVEADEILEKLSEQLVDLEQNPQDAELLNAVFRGFHTIKGGAGFLALTALVEVCHHAEDVFNILRQGDRVVDAPLMDAFLRVTDSVNDMFDEVKEGIDPTPADPELIQTLEKFLSGGEDTVMILPTKSLSRCWISCMVVQPLVLLQLISLRVKPQ